MDRKEWSRIVEQAADRYRLHVAGENAYDTDDAAWGPTTRKEATVEDHITEFAQCLADVGREQLG